MLNSWFEYQNDLNAMTDEEVAEETRRMEDQAVEAEAWLEAVAAWDAAGRPRPSREDVARVLGKIDGATWTDTYVQFTTPEHNGPPEKYYRMADAILSLLGRQS
jgi:hypothetical protein